VEKLLRYYSIIFSVQALVFGASFLLKGEVAFSLNVSALVAFVVFLSSGSIKSEDACSSVFLGGVFTGLAAVVAALFDDPVNSNGVFDTIHLLVFALVLLFAVIACIGVPTLPSDTHDKLPIIGLVAVSLFAGTIAARAVIHFTLSYVVLMTLAFIFFITAYFASKRIT